MIRRAFFVSALWAFSGLALAQDKPVTPPALPPGSEVVTNEQKQKVLDGINKLMEERAFVPGVDFKKWPEFLTKKKEDIDKAEKPDAFIRTVNTILRDFGVSHVRLLTPRQAVRRTQTSMTGIGVGVMPQPEGLRVSSVREGSPAEAAGLKTGDVIVLVNGTLPTSEAALGGDEGTKHKLKFKRESEEKEVEVPVATISLVRKETLAWPKEDVAVLKIFSFGPRNYDRTNVENLVREASAKAKTVVVDLRGNGGGAVNHLNHLLSQFLPGNSDYGTFVSRRLADDYAKAHENKPGTTEEIAQWTKTHTKTRIGDGPLATKNFIVLINRGSGSASEICAAALSEIKGAKLVGSNSAGAVLASIFAPLPEGYSLQLPISDYITIKGRRLEKNPLVPDVEVKEPVTKEKDPVLEKALELAAGG